MRVYIIVFEDGMAYVGATTMPFKKRIACHEQDSRRPQWPVSKHWAAQGEPLFWILSEHGSKEEMFAAEIQAIADYGTQWPNGLNRTAGGNHQFSETEEGRAATSARSRGNKYCAGRANAAGKRTQEQRQRMSDAYWVSRVRRGMLLFKPSVFN